MTKKKFAAIEKRKAELGSVVRSVREYKQDETFEQLVGRRFEPFLGASIREIASRCNVTISERAKHIAFLICRAILGVKTKKIAEFEKAGINLKTVKLEPNGRLAEAMSFKNVYYKSIVSEETWEDSYWYDTLGVRRFFIVVFRKKRGVSVLDTVLENVFFWSMPRKDVDACEYVWRDTRNKVMANDYTHFIKESEHPICHIRPKGNNGLQMIETPQGGKAKKYCYWLNRAYVHNLVMEHMK